MPENSHFREANRADRQAIMGDIRGTCLMPMLKEILIPVAATAFVVPRDVTIAGTVHFDGPVMVEGVVDGGVRSPTVQIAKDGIVEGTIVADHVVVLGGVNGSIYARELVLRTECTVEGRIFHSALVLENGCYFEGQSRRYIDPISMAPDP